MPAPGAIQVGFRHMSDRMLRINEAVREVLSEAVQDLSDPRIGFLTITGVNVARDFRNAKVYISVMGTEEERKSALAGLQAAAGFIRHELVTRLSLRRVPDLSFIRDDSIERGTRVLQIMHELEQEASAREPGAGGRAPKKG